MKRRLDAAARRGAPGGFVTLSEGKTHFELGGPQTGPRLAGAIVLIHGFSVPFFVWDPTFEALLNAGFRVLRYDLYGRGYSDRPRGRYDLTRFDRQLTELIAVLGVETPVDLVGLSMGGAIAIGITDRHPELVRGLVLIDPAGFPMPTLSPMWPLRIPLVGELLMATVGRWLLATGLKKHVRRPEQLPELAKKYRVQMRYRGFLRALLSTMRHGPLQNMADAYARVGRQQRDVLLIWGREDRTVPFELSETVRTVLPRARFHAIAGSGHAPHLERPDLVNRLLVNYLSRV
ncbi:MAG: alpha/beta fold hydrolase [Anaerolineae bacterium]